MIMNNKILQSALVGIVVGIVIGLVIGTPQINWLSMGSLGGILGFLLGWIIATRATTD